MDWDGFGEFVVGTALVGIFVGLLLLIARSVFKGVSAAKKERMVDEQKVGRWFLGAIIAGLLIGLLLEVVLVRVFSVNRGVSDTIGRSLSMAITLFFGWIMWQFLRVGKL